MRLLLRHIILVSRGCHTSTCLELEGSLKLVKKKNSKGNPTPKSRLHQPWKCPRHSHGYHLLNSRSVVYIIEHGVCSFPLCYGRNVLLHIVTELQNSMEVEDKFQLRLFEDFINLCSHPGLDRYHRREKPAVALSLI